MGKGVACRNTKYRILDEESGTKRKHEKPRFRGNIRVTWGLQGGTNAPPMFFST
jgi:hypothetical protein